MVTLRVDGLQAEKPKKYIGVMGVTGSGKSTFIKTATGIEDIEVGTSMLSCTTQVKPYTFNFAGEEIVLIDTPGFNDTLRSESEILKDIANWLDYSFRNPPQTKLAGIIYLQAITDRRMYGSTLRNLKMFRELCGEDPLKNVILATTGWGAAKLAGDFDKAVANEQQLQDAPEFWKPLIKRKARVARFEDTKGSAMSIIMSLVDREPQMLQIQKELVLDDKSLVNTSAGRVVNEELKKLEEKYKRELADIQEEMTAAIAARDVEIQESLAISRAQIEKMRDDARRAQDELLYKSRNDSRTTESLRTEIEDLRGAMERLQAGKEAKHKRSVEKRLADQKREFQEQLRKMKADQYEQQMKFEGIVKKLRANQKKLRREENRVVEAKIIEEEESAARTKDKRGRGSRLLEVLSQTLGVVTMSVLGFAF